MVGGLPSLSVRVTLCSAFIYMSEVALELNGKIEILQKGESCGSIGLFLLFLVSHLA